MIAIVRNNLACLISKHRSPVSFALSPHFFSTNQNVICPKVYDLLVHKHHFSPEVASLVASRPKSPEKADLVLSFLKGIGCSNTQLQKMVIGRPQILSQGVEGIKFKIKLFQELGLSPEDIARLVSSNEVILTLSAKSKIIPSLSVLKGLLGSDFDVARLLRRSAWPLGTDLEKTVVPNVEFLKSVGIPMGHIQYLLYSYSRCLLHRPVFIRKSVEKAKEMGFNESSKVFVHALGIITSMSQGMWEVKLQSFQEMGFSESDSLTMFRKCPTVFNKSRKKIEKVKQLLLATGKFDMSSIVKYPSILGFSIEKRLEPRLRILQTKNLIKWPCLGTIFTLSEDKFIERFVRPYSNEHLYKGCVKHKN